MRIQCSINLLYGWKYKHPFFLIGYMIEKKEKIISICFHNHDDSYYFQGQKIGSFLDNILSKRFFLLPHNGCDDWIIHKTYMVLSIIIPILSLIVGLNFANYILATMMIVIEIIFSILLVFENKKIKND